MSKRLRLTCPECRGGLRAVADDSYDQYEFLICTKCNHIDWSLKPHTSSK